MLAQLRRNVFDGYLADRPTGLGGLGLMVYRIWAQLCRNILNGYLPDHSIGQGGGVMSWR